MMPDVTALPDYLVDATQRMILFLDLLRQRGNEAVQMQAEPNATVLRFPQEEIMSGRSLRRPMNYSLSRILPLPGIAADPTKRPVVVVDPRAGEGPGIGGFKTESEIGDALRGGHPVYFIGFSALPVPGQQFLDVIEGQVAFFERIVALHPQASRPFAIGNCQAGYQTLMVAMLRPDLFGPCLLVGSPMSYWQGLHGRDPMRYAAGLLGGSWLTAMTSDLGGGLFDGSWLVLNFDKLGPANWLWGKQYKLYANVDTDGPRYLEFEKWWGDFVELGGDELQFLVDNMFIGDRLVRGGVTSSDGTVFDIRNVTAPIIVFASAGDNISPPPQALGWIADLYADVDAIRAADQTIVYCLNRTAGHLALFVSSKVGAREDEAFVEVMDLIDCLPPGLFEMIITANEAGGLATRFEPRGIGDITALGRNSVDDERAFAAVARLSELNLSMDRAFVQPWMRALATKPVADAALALNPLRLSYSMFADANPWMRWLQPLAAAVTSSRREVSVDNPLIAVQEDVSAKITAGLDAYRAARDQAQEKMFFALYGSPLLQAFLGIDEASGHRPRPVGTPVQLAGLERMHRRGAMIGAGGANEALIRAVLYVIGADGVIDERFTPALNVARRQQMHLSLAGFKAMVRDQFFIVLQEPVRAIEALAVLVPDAVGRAALLAEVEKVVAAGSESRGAEQERLQRLRALLAPAPGQAA